MKKTFKKLQKYLKNVATERFSQNLISSNSYVWFHNLVGSFCIEDCIRNNWILGSLPLCHHASFVKFMLYPENARISEETIKPQCRALLARTPM